MPTPVIIDTDPGVDDTLAILLALASPELQILAITITFGNTDVEHSRNILKIWHALNQHFEKHPEDQSRFPIFTRGYQGHIPFIARGSEGPLEGKIHSASYFHGRDGLSGITTRHPELSILEDWQPPFLRTTSQNAIELSLDLIRRHTSRSITYIALGPLTNLAWMVRNNAALVRDKIGRVVAMGGALHVPGNTTPVAEFNFFADPFAVCELLHPSESSLGLPLNRFVLLPLDITSKHRLTFPDYKEFIDPEFGTSISPSQPEKKSPLVHFVTSFLERTAEVMWSFGENSVALHDPIAVWCAICNPPVIHENEGGPLLRNGWVIQRRTFQVERIGEFTRGMLVVDQRASGEYQPGDNRAEVYRDDHAIITGRAESSTHLQAAHTSGVEGVAILTESPSTEGLARVMFKRIWGVDVPEC